jgi:hypothetical protein
MATIRESARKSTTSVFDLFRVTAESATQLVTTGTRAISMLDAKAELMHDRVTTNCKLQRLVMTDEEILAAADRHTDLMEDSHRRNYPGVPFDRATYHAQSVVTMRQALEA